MTGIPLPTREDVAVLIALLDDDTLRRYHGRLIDAHGQAGMNAYHAGRLLHERQAAECPECGGDVVHVSTDGCDDAGAELVWEFEPWACTDCDAAGDRDGTAA